MIIGCTIILSSFSGLTGFVISEGSNNQIISALGLGFISAGFLLLTLRGKKTKTLEGIAYEVHASERMNQRNLMPSAVRGAIKTGNHYKLKNGCNFDGTSGATDLYVGRGSANIAPGGRIGRRIIKAGSGKGRYKNLLVLTNNNKVVKTCFVRTDSELKSFKKRYVR